jgi:hypothetical protein
MFAHGERHDSAGSGPSGHPELEEIAALVDGRLPEARAARLRLHLAECDECREVFLGAVDFIRDEEALGREADPLPFEPAVALRNRSRDRLLQLVILPAAAVLSVAIGLAIYRSSQSPPDFTQATERLAQRLSSPPLQSRVAAPLSRRARGGSPVPAETSRKPSFDLGAALFALRASAEAQNHDQTDNALTTIIRASGRFPRPPERTTDFFAQLRQQLSTAKDLRPLAEDAEREVDRHYQHIIIPLYFNFGRWTEAGDLAAYAEDASFLQHPEVRSFPGYLRKHAEDLEPEALEAVRNIEPILEKPELEAEDYQALVRNFDRILRIL